jgi:hypothetical protein
MCARMCASVGGLACQQPILDCIMRYAVYTMHYAPSTTHYVMCVMRYLLSQSYTSFTGYFTENSAGSIQLLLTAQVGARAWAQVCARVRVRV